MNEERTRDAVKNQMPQTESGMPRAIPSTARTDYSRWRVASLVAIHLLIALHITHWLLTGRTLAPLEFNEVLHTLHAGILTAGFVFMMVTLIGTLLAGRFFCSWGCHILALQDLSAWILKKLQIRPVPIRSRVLRWVPTLSVIYLFVWPALVRLLEGAGLPQFRVQSDGEGWGSFVTNHFWRNLPGPGMAILTFLVVGGVMVYFLGTRSFCRYACPYGAIFGWADRVAPGKIKLVGDCSQCGLCTAQCQSQILVHREVARFGRVVNPQCLKDLDCVTVCPQQALAFGLGQPSWGLSLPKEEQSVQPQTFTPIEEAMLAVLTLGLVLIYRGLYDAVPFLLAVALACIQACLLVFCARMFHRPTVWLCRGRLKNEGRWENAGFAWVGVGILLTGFSLHSGWVHYHAEAGRHALARAVPPAARGSTRLSAHEGVHEEELSRAKARLVQSERSGFWVSTRLRHDLATVYGLGHEVAEMESQLRLILAAQPDDLAARVRLGRLLFSDRRLVDAKESLSSALAISPARFGPSELALRSEAGVLLGQVKEQDGLAAQALIHYEAAESDDVRNGEAALARGTLLARLGRFEEAESPLSRAAKTYSDPPVVWENQAVVSLNRRRYSEAIDRFRQVLQARPKQVPTLYHLGVALYEAGQREQAAERFQEVLLLDPVHQQARAALALAQRREAPQ